MEQDQQQKVKALKEHPLICKKIDVDGYCQDDETYLRYLRAREFDVEAAAKMLAESLDWRAEYLPGNRTCAYCVGAPGYHSWRQIGFDRQGRAVTYSCIAQGKTSGLIADDCIQHASFLVENCVASMRTTGATDYVWILDMTGITMGSCNPKLAYATQKLFSGCYPERLGYAIIINHPWIFNATWVALKSFMDKKTCSKIFFATDNMESVFNEKFPPDLASWLLEEIRLNKKIDAKQLGFWKSSPVEPGSHDPRGCPAYVQSIVNPFLETCKALELKGRKVTHSGMVQGSLENDVEDPAGKERMAPVNNSPGLKRVQIAFKSKTVVPHPNIVGTVPNIAVEEPY